MKLFEIGVNLACLTGFVYQTLLLSLDYMSGETVTRVMMVSRIPDYLPGVTICYPGMISLLKLSKLNDQTNQMYQEYLGKLENFRRFDQIEKNESLLRNVKKEMEILYNDKLSELVLELNISLYDLLANYSFDFWDNVDMVGKMPTAPIESVLMNRQGDTLAMNKCLTFFSHLDERNRYFRKSYLNFFLQIIVNMKEFPLFPGSTIKFALHSPNTFPLTTALIKSQSVNYGGDHYLFYKVRTELLDER